MGRIKKKETNKSKEASARFTPRVSPLRVACRVRFWCQDASGYLMDDSSRMSWLLAHQSAAGSDLWHGQQTNVEEVIHTAASLLWTSSRVCGADAFVVGCSATWEGSMGRKHLSNAQTCADMPVV